ncbi:MAG: Coenzyme F420 hydrogenase/dehydrogenase, beta subunit C-terminal domain [Bacteroidaceae bacterium]
MIKYISTNDAVDCYGCRACEQICAQKALHLEPNGEGFLYPILNLDQCTNCGLCSKVCPVEKTTTNKVLKTVATRYNDNSTLCYSASGGMFLAAAEYTISQGGYVAGCVFDEYFNAIHILSNDRNDIRRMQGSKYVQSNIGNVYIEIRRILKQGELVLFSGTPCQVDGLQNFLRKDYDNLYTLDLICHGVPSPKFLQDYLDATHRVNGEIIDLKFRNKVKN